MHKAGTNSRKKKEPDYERYAQTVGCRCTGCRHAVRPRQQDKARDEMQGLQNLMNDKLDKLEEGLATADKMSSSAEQKGAWGDPSKSVLVSAMFGFLGDYNKNTGMEVAGGRIFVSVTGKYDHTYTSFIMVGAVPLPWYWGIQASASGGLDVSLFDQTKVPVEQTNNNAMVKAICNPDGISSTGSNVTLSLAFSIGIYVGLGVRKVLCVEGSGSLGLTMSICLLYHRQPLLHVQHLQWLHQRSPLAE